MSLSTYLRALADVMDHVSERVEYHSTQFENYMAHKHQRQLHQHRLIKAELERLRTLPRLDNARLLARLDEIEQTLKARK